MPDSVRPIVSAELRHAVVGDPAFEKSIGVCQIVVEVLAFDSFTNDKLLSIS